MNAVNEAIKTVAQRKDGNVHYIDLADHLDAEHASKEDKLHLRLRAMWRLSKPSRSPFAPSSKAAACRSWRER